MKILFIISTLDIKYGGPVRAIIDISSELSRIGHECDIVTLDDENSTNFQEVPVKILPLGPKWGVYSYCPRLVKWLISNGKKYDAIIVSGIWQYQSFATWFASKIISIDYFIFTHGALNPWFKFNHPLKHIKKLIYWLLVEFRVLRDAAGVLFTSQGEKEAASESFPLYNVNDIVISYGIQDPLGYQSKEIKPPRFLDEIDGKEYILYLGRIRQVKGIDDLISGFQEVIKNNHNLYLVLAGPYQKKYRRKLNLKINQRFEKRIIWTGMLTGDEKWGALNFADALILPSHSESFGIVIAEAMACGTPVLISNKVNIWQEVVSCNAGFVSDDSVEGVMDLLKFWIDLSEKQKLLIRHNARLCFSTKFDLSNTVKGFIETINNGNIL